MLQLCPRLTTIAAQLQTEGADAQSNAADDEDAARGIARLCIEAGETYTDMLIAGGAEALLRNDIVCCNVPSAATMFCTVRT